MEPWEREIIVTIVSLPSELVNDTDLENVIKHALLIRKETHYGLKKHRGIYENAPVIAEQIDEDYESYDEACRAAYLSGCGPLMVRMEGLELMMSQEEEQRHAALPYNQFLQTRYWKTLREAILERDKWCRLCTVTDRLVVHHATYDHRGSEYRFQNDLITLCSPCHSKVHHANHETQDADQHAVAIQDGPIFRSKNSDWNLAIGKEEQVEVELC